jgi:preprotein translocase subunit SecG
MVTILLTLVHVVVALILILVVLLQTGKRADLAGAFGGGGSQTAFGTRGAATFLSKLTTTAAVLFMLTSLGLSLVSARSRGGSESVLPDEAPAPVGAPVLPTPSAPEQGLPGAPTQEPGDGAESSPEDPGTPPVE